MSVDNCIAAIKLQNWPTAVEWKVLLPGEGRGVKYLKRQQQNKLLEQLRAKEPQSRGKGGSVELQ